MLDRIVLRVRGCEQPFAHNSKESTEPVRKLGNAPRSKGLVVDLIEVPRFTLYPKPTDRFETSDDD